MMICLEAVQLCIGVWRVAPVGSHRLGDFIFVPLADDFVEILCKAPLEVIRIAEKAFQIGVIRHRDRAADERLWGKRLVWCSVRCVRE